MDLEALKIDLKGLDEGQNRLDIDLDDAYFGAIEASEVSRGSVHVGIDIVRTDDDIFTLHFIIDGHVIVACDRCLGDMEQPITAEERLTARFGEEDSEDDDLVTVAENEGILDVTWLIYEFIVLAIPIRHVHEPGKCDPAMIRVLEEHTAARSGEEDEDAVDPRWEALKKLKNKN